MSSLVLDIILVCIVAAICINAFIQGLLVSLFNLLSSLAATVLAYLFYPVLSGLLGMLPVYGWIRQPIADSLTKMSLDLGIQTAEGFLEHLDLPGVISDRVREQLASEAGLGTAGLIKQISETVTEFLLGIIAIVLLFIIIKILFLFVKKIIKNITKLPLIKQADRLGGLLLGVLESFVILTIVGALFVLFSGGLDGSIIEAVEQSLIGKFFYQDNLLIGILSGKI